MDKGTVTIREVYVAQQTDAIVESPSSSKRLIIWNCVLEATSEAVVKFAVSGTVIAQVSGGALGVGNLCLEGAVGEDILISCPAGTKLILMFDEL